MAQNSKRRAKETTIRESVRRIVKTGRFAPASFPLPAEDGEQLSLTGAPFGWGNGGELKDEALIAALRSFPAMVKASESELEKYAARRRFFLFPGDGDRFVAAADTAAELIASGILKIIVTADTPSERDNLVRFLEMAQPGNAAVSAYIPGEYDEAAKYGISASVFAYLTSPKPEILVLSRDTFSRRTNLIRQPIGNAPEETLCTLIAKSRPAVICSARTTDGARTLARLSEIFDPPMEFLISGEVRAVREAVIWKPAKKKKSTGKPKAEPEEMDVIMDL